MFEINDLKMNRADELGFKGGVFYENMTFEEFCALNAQRLEKKKDKMKRLIFDGLNSNLAFQRKHEYDMAELAQLKDDFKRIGANNKRLDDRLDHLEADFKQIGTDFKQIGTDFKQIGTDFKQIGKDQKALRERINRFQENAKAFIVLGNCLKNSIE